MVYIVCKQKSWGCHRIISLSPLHTRLSQSHSPIATSSPSNPRADLGSTWWSYHIYLQADECLLYHTCLTSSWTINVSTFPDVCFNFVNSCWYMIETWWLVTIFFFFFLWQVRHMWCVLYVSRKVRLLPCHFFSPSHTRLSQLHSPIASSYLPILQQIHAPLCDTPGSLILVYGRDLMTGDKSCLRHTGHMWCMLYAGSLQYCHSAIPDMSNHFLHSQGHWCQYRAETWWQVTSFVSDMLGICVVYCI